MANNVYKFNYANVVLYKKCIECGVGKGKTFWQRTLNIDKIKLKRQKKYLIDVKLKLKYECQKIAEVKYKYSIKGERRSLGMGTGVT